MRRPSLRTRILLLVLLGGILPLGLVGLWLVGSTRRSGEELVRARLAEALDEVVRVAGGRWTAHRAVLLDFATHPAVLEALQQSSAAREGISLASGFGLAPFWHRVSMITTEVVIRNGAGTVVLRLPEQPEAGVASPVGRSSGLVSVSLPVNAPYPGERLGTLEARLTVESLVPVLVLTPGVGGSVLGVFDPATGDPLVPLAQEPALLDAERFEWGGEEWLTVERRLLDPPLRFVMAGPTGAFQEPFEEAGRGGLLALLFVTAGVVLLTAVLTHRFTASLEDLSRAADRVALGDLSGEVPESGAPEVARTARAFNAMTRSLERSIQRLSQQEAVSAVGEFAASLAHEVRNPLTSVQLALERAQRKLRTEPEDAEALLERALGEIERLNVAVGDALKIARSGGGPRERMDLRRPLEAACRAAEPHLEARGVPLERDLPADPVWVTADGGAIEQLVLNLLLNAADAAARGGRAGVAVEREETGACIRVWDTGEGIPPENVERIFEPFFSTRREGTGLGLSIARRIARAHGSDLSVENRPDGGATFSFRLPKHGHGPLPPLTR